LLRETIVSGGGLYDKSYVELCIAIYWSVLNTLVASPEAPGSVKTVLCSGMQRAETLYNNEDTKEAIAWALRNTIDAVITDLTGSERSIFESWLLTQKEAESMEVTCIGRTSMAEGTFYDGENNDVLDDDEILGGNATFSVGDWNTEREERASSAGPNSVSTRIAFFLAWSWFVVAASQT